MAFYPAAVRRPPEPLGMTAQPRFSVAARQSVARIHTGVSSQPGETKGQRRNPRRSRWLVGSTYQGHLLSTLAICQYQAWHVLSESAKSGSCSVSADNVLTNWFGRKDSPIRSPNWRAAEYGSVHPSSGGHGTRVGLFLGQRSSSNWSNCPRGHPAVPPMCIETSGPSRDCRRLAETPKVFPRRASSLTSSRLLRRGKSIRSSTRRCQLRSRTTTDLRGHLRDRAARTPWS